ncbi:MAG: anthranilate phosphoribosyltransferase [Candidatus Ratteibacteria bacterium]|nr:anthranilate phosphoribosyltransferase [Candidatus Ratteibacteria bacterium]
MIKEAISKVIEKIDLSQREMESVMDEIMTGRSSPAQIGAFLTALRLKGETVEEITGAARVMRQKAARIKTFGDKVKIDEDEIIDTCGTGGTGTNTFNVSTTSAFVAAGAGLKVAKHGNKSVSSLCGSADVIDALGISLKLSSEAVGECIKEVGIGFLFAPLFHRAMKYAIGPRREIGIRTIFNILGPLTNPAGATSQVMGVYEEKLTEILARVLGNLGLRHALVVHGMDGLDEITVTRESKISEFKEGKVKTYYLKPDDFSLSRAVMEDIKGGRVKKNAEMVIEVLKGEKGAPRDIVLLNAAAAFIAADRVKNFKEGINMAEASIDEGKALEKLEALRKKTQELGKSC